MKEVPARDSAQPLAPSATKLTAAQARVLDAALRLFAVHGISGTSLSMIAEEIGVTKAAVYHQYRAKDEIVLAIAEQLVAGLDAVIKVAEAQRTQALRRETLIEGLVRVAVERRGVAGVLQQDPVMLRCLQEQESFRQVMSRLESVLLGGSSTPAMRVSAAVVVTAIAGAVVHPLTLSLSDRTLRTELRQQLRKLFAR